jgi:hypothetical protein
VAHVEAGLRSFDRGMPEEINRLVTDTLADLLLVSEPAGEENLRAWPLVEDVLAGRYKAGQPIPGWDGRAAERLAAALAERYAARGVRS